ncbi:MULTISPECIES: hypothetical protein [unclassified Brucella]|uniref:hypothetical protein n=1 Tax=unclassified Brucella TaxID=2632610 RepID=UPI00097281D6|nr:MULTISPECIES: hypothetical protein [unclassified Brucella]APX70273.1 hypothetical protein BKD03_13665 [Brucella sp. 09RB8471]MRN79833.1 hypothetical protein [Brucella sp. 10RB9210]
MTLDVRGSLKNTKISSNPYVVFEELISNAIDSFLIRKNGDAPAKNLEIQIAVDFSPIDLLNEQFELAVTCSDNGCGLGDDQLKAFLTKDTSYKDDLAIAGIGKCKGAGRVQFFHHFSNVKIDSVYSQGAVKYKRSLVYTEAQKQIDESDFTAPDKVNEPVGTRIRLSHFKESTRERIFHGDDLRITFSPKNLKNQTLVAFLQRLIGLESQLGEFVISFTTSTIGSVGKVKDATTLKRSDLPTISSTRTAEVKEQDPKTGLPLSTHKTLTLSHYKLNAHSYHLPRNAIAFCAKSSPVKDITNRYLRTKTEQNSPMEGFHHIILIEGDILDTHVNEQRDNFENIPEEIQAGDLFGVNTISYQSIYEAIDDVIAELITPPDWKKEEVVNDMAEKFGVSEAMLSDTDTRVRYGDSAQTVVERVLKKYQERIITDTAKIFDLKEEIVNSEPDTDEFRTKINELSWRYTASLKSFDMANLSQLIVRRAAIVDVLSLACRKQLTKQLNIEGKRRQDERIIHSIFFPMQKDSTEIRDHDIWLLSEEYHYYDYIASDKPLAKIRWDDSTNLFDPDIDAEFEKLLKDRTDENGGKRPDIALFNKEGSAIIIEFKAPDVPMDDHTGDLIEYAHLLAAKSGGRLKKFYGYLIGDTLNPLRLQNWIRFPAGKGFFNSSAVQDPYTGRQLGELYSEILFYDDVVDRAKKRIGVYQGKLNLKLNE